MASTLGLRQAYQTIKAAYAQKNRNPVTTSSDLRLVVPIASGKTLYSFPVLVGDDPNNYSFATLLNRADAFTATEIGMFVGLTSSSSPSTTFDWFSYPNTSIFTGSAGTDLKTLFNNSNLNIAINNVQYLQNFSTSRFRKAPITQTGLGFGYGTGGAVVSTSTDSFNGDVDGYYPLVPTLQLSGTSKIDISIQLPTAITNLVASSTTYLMLAMRGFLSLGASNLNK